MKIIQLTLFLFLFFTHTDYTQKNTTQDTDKALSILLADYSKTSDLQSVNTKKFIMNLSKENLSTKGMKIKKVKQLTYITSKNEKRTIYLIQKVDGMAFSGRISDFNISVFGDTYETQKDDDDEEIICTIVFNTCKIGNCEVSCIVSDSCAGDGSSNPNCCNDVTCDEEEGPVNSLTDPLEILMG